MGFCFKNVSQSNGKKKRKRGKKVMKSICDSNSHVQILKTDFSTYILLPENPSSLWGALVKCPEVLKDWGWCMTLALNEHPWLKFHHRKSGATYSLKSDFLQPVFSFRQCLQHQAGHRVKAQLCCWRAGGEQELSSLMGKETKLILFRLKACHQRKAERSVENCST